MKRAERAALDSLPPVRSQSRLVRPAHCSLPRMKLSFSVKPTLISGNATQLHMEHKSFNTPLITHNTPMHHTHSDDCWDAYPGLCGHKHLRFWPREHRVWLQAAPSSLACHSLVHALLEGSQPWRAVLKATGRALCSCVKGLVTEDPPTAYWKQPQQTCKKSPWFVCACVCVCVYIPCYNAIPCYVAKLKLFESSGYEPVIVALWQYW